MCSGGVWRRFVVVVVTAVEVDWSYLISLQGRILWLQKGRDTRTLEAVERQGLGGLLLLLVPRGERNHCDE